MTILMSRVKLLLLALVVTFVLLRVWLHHFPNTDLNVGGYNIHHLFTGLLLITLGGIPLVVWQGRSRWLDVATLSFGVGLSLALDEWVFLIATDGTNAAYLLPVSFWGGVVLLALACGYVLGLAWLARRQRNAAASSSSPASGGR
jgi:hypothetical protein